MSIYTQREGATQHPETMLDFLDSRVVLSSGVFDKSAGSFAVSQKSTPEMKVQVATGFAFLKKTSIVKVYPVYSDVVFDVDIPTNSSGSTVVRAVVMYANRSISANTTATNVILFTTVIGTGSSIPTDGEIETAIGASTPYTRLANVTVASGATQILTANISDVRSEVVFRLPSGVTVVNGTTPATPATGEVTLYSLTSNKKLAFKNSDGNEFILGNSMPTIHVNATRTAGAITITGITSAYADIGSEATQTITTNGGVLLLTFNGILNPNIGTYPQTTRINLRVDSTDYIITSFAHSANVNMSASFTKIVSGLSAGSHTIKIQVGHNAQGSIQVSGSSAQPFSLQILEFPIN